MAPSALAGRFHHAQTDRRQHQEACPRTGEELFVQNQVNFTIVPALPEPSGRCGWLAQAPSWFAAHPGLRPLRAG
ncbi:hypothetical protein [Roseomonas genomospecies 6]|uniref:hypothetical protein n=1 Tax=Roseomonas genomospecies 6 TaxID=214106 RepID=UPI0011F2BE52|nr:hypothetical protein [Roseomonas genomospecies 6]